MKTVHNVSKNRSANWSEDSNLLTSQVVYIGPGCYYLPDLYVRSDNFRLLFQNQDVIKFTKAIIFMNQIYLYINEGGKNLQ